MTGVEILALSAVGFWLLVLSIATMLVVRQLSLVTIRLSMASPLVEATEHGPAIGMRVSTDVLEALGEPDQPLVLAFAKGMCEPCTDFAKSLDSERTFENTVFAVIGETELTTEIREAVPEQATVLGDPIAANIASDLGVDLMPFAVRIANDRVVAKTRLRDAADLSAIEEPDELGDEELVVVPSGTAAT